MNNTNEHTGSEDNDSKRKESLSRLMPFRQSELRSLMQAVQEESDQEKNKVDEVNKDSSINIGSKHEGLIFSEIPKIKIVQPTPQKQSIMQIIQQQSLQKDNRSKTILNSAAKISKLSFNTPQPVNRPFTSVSDRHKNADHPFPSVLTPSFSKSNVQRPTNYNIHSALQSSKKSSQLGFTKSTPLPKKPVQLFDDSGIDKLEETQNPEFSPRQQSETKENDSNILKKKTNLTTFQLSEGKGNTIPLISLKEESTKQPLSEPKILFQSKVPDKPFFQRMEAKTKNKKLYKDDIEKRRTMSADSAEIRNPLHKKGKELLNPKPINKAPVIPNKAPPTATITEPIKVNADKNEKSLSVGNEDYIIESKLGEGGSSVVYLTTSKRTMEQRAVKVVNLSGDPTLVEGYLNEVKLLCRLQGSDRVIRMFQYVHLTSTKQLLVVMERGETDLQCLIKKSQQGDVNTLPISTLADYWIQMLEAVKYIHDNGVIHSDLKPANFLYVSGRLKLIDFGIASSITEDQTSVIKHLKTGTFNYMSPEALQESSGPNSPHRNGQPNIKITYKSDVWSLGCILYLLLYSRTPFSHIKRGYAKMAAITDPEPKVNYPELLYYPPIFVKIVQKCLVNNPKSRPSVEQLLELPRWPFKCPHQSDIK